MSAAPSFTLTPAQRDDVPQLLRLIGELAEFERLSHLVECDEARLTAALFGPRPYAEAIVARVAGADTTPVGFALFFHNFSTFLGRPGLYLEDLFVRADYRRRGCATALLRELARLAVARGCGRFEWSVLDWNTPAQAFYARVGADLLPDWRITRLTGAALERFAASAD